MKNNLTSNRQMIKDKLNPDKWIKIKLFQTQ